MDARKEIKRFLSQRGAPSGRKLSVNVGVSPAYIASLLKGRHSANYEVAEKLGAIVFPEPSQSEKRQRFVLSLVAGREVAA